MSYSIWKAYCPRVGCKRSTSSAFKGATRDEVISKLASHADCVHNDCPLTGREMAKLNDNMWSERYSEQGELIDDDQSSQADARHRSRSPRPHTPQHRADQSVVIGRAHGALIDAVSRLMTDVDTAMGTARRDLQALQA